MSLSADAKESCQNLKVFLAKAWCRWGISECNLFKNKFKLGMRSHSVKLLRIYNSLPGHVKTEVLHYIQVDAFPGVTWCLEPAGPCWLGLCDAAVMLRLLFGLGSTLYVNLVEFSHKSGAGRFLFGLEPLGNLNVSLENQLISYNNELQLESKCIGCWGKNCFVYVFQF